MKPSDLKNETKINEQDDSQYFDTSEKILNLSDSLAEDIILQNIEDQLMNDTDPLHERFNYVSLFREKYSNITPDSDEYDEEYMKEAMARVASVIGLGIEEKYGVRLGEDLDYTTPAQYLYDMETLYEFLFIRHYENLIEFLKYRLKKDRDSFVQSYSKLMIEDQHGKDIFVQQSKKKFRDHDDVVILHFLNEILYDIRGQVNSAYDLFTEIVNLDLFEEYNNRMSELLINYGNKIVLENDVDAADKYFSLLEDQDSFSDIRNAVMISYLEGAALDD